MPTTIIQPASTLPQATDEGNIVLSGPVPVAPPVVAPAAASTAQEVQQCRDAREALPLDSAPCACGSWRIPKWLVDCFTYE